MKETPGNPCGFFCDFTFREEDAEFGLVGYFAEGLNHMLPRCGGVYAYARNGRLLKSVIVLRGAQSRQIATSLTTFLRQLEEGKHQVIAAEVGLIEVRKFGTV